MIYRNESILRMSAFCLFILLLKVHGQSVTDTVKHSTIVEADGYAYLSEDKTLSAMREEAIALAKREALERGETYIQSISKVENFQLQYDLIQSESEGYVTIIENKDFGITDDNRYHVWIKAEVAFRPKSTGSGSEIIDAGPLFVRLWTDKDVYQPGDQINIFLESNRDCYVRVMHVSAGGEVLQLLPNPHRQDNQCKKGVALKIPDADDTFKLEVVPPFGREEIVVYASSDLLGDIPLSDTGTGMYITQATEQAVAQKTRGLRITPVDTNHIQAAEFVEVRRSILIER